MDLERLRNLLNQADEKLAAANQSLEVTRRQKNEQVRYPRLYCMHHKWIKHEIERGGGEVHDGLCEISSVILHASQVCVTRECTRRRRKSVVGAVML